MTVYVCVCVCLVCVCVCVSMCLCVHLKFCNAKALAMGTDSPAHAAYQCCNEHCICKAARTCVCVFACPIKGGFLFTCWWGVWSKLIAYQESKPALPGVCVYVFVCICQGSCVCVCVIFWANCLSEDCPGPCLRLESSLCLSACFGKCMRSCP